MRILESFPSSRSATTVSTISIPYYPAFAPLILLLRVTRSNMYIQYVVDNIHHDLYPKKRSDNKGRISSGAQEKPRREGSWSPIVRTATIYWAPKPWGAQ